MDQWRDELIPHLQKKGWWGLVQDRKVTGTDDQVFIGPKRLENIFVTNFRMANAAARWKTLQAGKAFMPYIHYQTMGDEHVRHSHQLLNNIVLPVDHPFWQVYFPPNDWGCRCTASGINDRMLARRGLKVTPDSELPDRAPKLFWRPGLSTPEVVPALVGPGFGYNPGVSYLRAFEPPRLDTPLSAPNLAARGPEGPVLPLPAPRALPAAIEQAADVTDEQLIERFLERFEPLSERVGDALVFTDAVGAPVVLSDQFFRRPDGSTKLQDDRRRWMLLLAETIISPDEIWWEWENVVTNQKTQATRPRLTPRPIS